MMMELDNWLGQATRRLSRDSAARVRTEIREHFEAARETAMSGGASAEEAERRAVQALGDATTANRQYRKVMLATGEARILREANWEARAVCSIRLGRWLLPAMFVAALGAATVFAFTGTAAIARLLLAGGILIGVLFAAPLLPVYTPSRARVYRWVKWAALATMLALVFGEDALRLSWLLASCAWIFIWIEWTRASIRKKLPVAEWPKQLYL